MITMFFFVGQSTGTGFVIPFFFICTAVYAGLFLCFKQTRTGAGIKNLLLSLLLSNLVCELFWYNLYFEDGSYVNPGMAGLYYLLLWPLILTLAGSVLRLTHWIGQNRVMRGKTAVLTLLVLTVLLGGCSAVQENRNSILILQNSSAKVYEIRYTCSDGQQIIHSGGMMNADGSPIRYSETVYLDCIADGMPESWCLELSVIGKNDELLAWGEFMIRDGEPCELIFNGNSITYRSE